MGQERGQTQNTIMAHSSRDFRIENYGVGDTVELTGRIDNLYGINNIRVSLSSKDTYGTIIDVNEARGTIKVDVNSQNVIGIFEDDHVEITSPFYIWKVIE